MTGSGNCQRASEENWEVEAKIGADLLQLSGPNPAVDRGHSILFALMITKDATHQVPQE